MTKEMAINILRGAVLGTNEQTHEAVFMAIKALKEQERVDAVEVVRCKDCRFFEDEDEYGNCYCSEWGNVTKANGYCHDAERKEDGKTD